MSEMEAWLERVSVPSYWTELCPEMHIGGAPAEPILEMSEELLFELRNAFLVEGYFQFPPLLPADVIARMAAATKALYDACIPLGFCYVFDEFWDLTRWIHHVLAALLGDGYRQLPDQWAWYVEPGSKGWPPHREKGVESLLPGGMPKSLSLWVPLTDATTLNGCMYVVPANLDPGYTSDGEGNGIDLQAVRALPVEAGALLMWNQALLHWGAASSPRALGPRVSFSIEYQRGDAEPMNRPLLDPTNAPPAFSHRLGLVGAQILQYEHMFSPVSDVVEMGRRLLARFPIEGLHAD